MSNLHGSIFAFNDYEAIDSASSRRATADPLASLDETASHLDKSGDCWEEDKNKDSHY
jgi:hypothetical protein